MQSQMVPHSYVHLQCLSVGRQAMSIPAAFYRGGEKNVALSNMLLLDR